MSDQSDDNVCTCGLGDLDARDPDDRASRFTLASFDVDAASCPVHGRRYSYTPDVPTPEGHCGHCGRVTQKTLGNDGREYCAECGALAPRSAQSKDNRPRRKRKKTGT